MNNSVDQLSTISQEAETLTSLSHPNIIKYHDSFNDENSFYIITDFSEVFITFNISNKKELPV